MNNKNFKIGDTVYYAYYSERDNKYQAIEGELIYIDKVSKTNPLYSISGVHKEYEYKYLIRVEEEYNSFGDKFKTVLDIYYTPEEAITGAINSFLNQQSFNSSYRIDLLKHIISNYDVNIDNFILDVAIDDIDEEIKIINSLVVQHQETLDNTKKQLDEFTQLKQNILKIINQDKTSTCKSDG